MCIWTKPFHAHNIFEPCDLDLELEVSVQVSKFATAIRKRIITTVSLQILLSYLICMCIGTTPYYAHKMFDPCDLDLEL